MITLIHSRIHNICRYCLIWCCIRFPVPVKLQNYEAAESKNDWDIQMFETQYEADLKTYEIDLKEEITSRK